MQTVSVEVSADHIDRLSKSRKPLLGILELIWNALDADAKNVSVFLVPNDTGGLEKIVVSDDGTGIIPDTLADTFGKLGGSWKATTNRTREEQRVLHGKQGMGRFRALSVGERIEWRTRFRQENQILVYAITLDSDHKQRFEISEREITESTVPGTEVSIYNVTSKLSSIEGDAAVAEITQQLALYLKQYPQVAVTYDGQAINPQSIISNSTDTSFIYKDENGVEHPHVLTVVEWLVPTQRALYLCSDDGFALEETPAGIQAPGFNFSAYLRSAYLADLNLRGLLQVEELGDVGKLREQAKQILREHFEARAREASSKIVESWKQEEVYPYKGEPVSAVEDAERKIFDVVAVSVSSYIDLKTAKSPSKKLTFNLLRYALESSPTALKRILEEVIGLPVDKQAEFAELLEKTSLSSFINASKVVTDRLTFLAGLESFLYDQPFKDAFKERVHLQRLIAENTWVFGDEYFLANDDEKLINVLRKHLAKEPESYDISTVDLTRDVLRADGQQGTVDLVLSTTPNGPPKDDNRSAFISKIVSKSSTELMHNLVIELKRPTQPITAKVIQQVRDYALAIARDERFENVPAKWTFWALSNTMSEDAQEQASSDQYPPGVIIQKGPDKGRMFSYTIITKTWAEVLNSARGRLEFYREHLQYSPSLLLGRKHLEERYKQFIPDLDVTTGEPLGEPKISGVIAQVSLTDPNIGVTNSVPAS